MTSDQVLLRIETSPSDSPTSAAADLMTRRVLMELSEMPVEGVFNRGPRAGGAAPFAITDYIWVIATLGVAKLAGSMISEVGKDAWTATKEAVRRIRPSKDPQLAASSIQVRIEFNEDGETRRVFLAIDAEVPPDVLGALDDTILPSGPGEESYTLVPWRDPVDGTWRWALLLRQGRAR